MTSVTVRVVDAHKDELNNRLPRDWMPWTAIILVESAFSCGRAQHPPGRGSIQFRVAGLCQSAK